MAALTIRRQHGHGSRFGGPVELPERLVADEVEQRRPRGRVERRAGDEGAAEPGRPESERLGRLEHHAPHRRHHEDDVGLAGRQGAGGGPGVEPGVQRLDGAERAKNAPEDRRAGMVERSDDEMTVGRPQTPGLDRLGDPRDVGGRGAQNALGTAARTRGVEQLQRRLRGQRRPGGGRQGRPRPPIFDRVASGRERRVAENQRRRRIFDQHVALGWSEPWAGRHEDEPEHRRGLAKDRPGRPIAADDQQAVTGMEAARAQRRRRRRDPRRPVAPRPGLDPAGFVDEANRRRARHHRGVARRIAQIDGQRTGPNARAKPVRIRRQNGRRANSSSVQTSQSSRISRINP